MVEPGKTYMVSRRTTRRYFLLTPDERRQLEQIYWYCLGYAAKEYGVLIHGACCMSSHPHEVITDVRGQYPDFLESFHRNLALCTKALRGWPGEVFDKNQTSMVELLTPKAVVQALAYVAANPVEAGAVRYASDWPGAITLPRDIGTRTIRAKRPIYYFDSDNPEWPDELELPIEMPAMLEDEYGPEQARALVAHRLRELEHEAWAKWRKAGIPFMGAKRAARQPHTRRASSYEQFNKINPRFAAAGDKDAASAAVQRSRQFEADYDVALTRWTAGDRRVQFPAGTWWMRVHHAARCRPPP